ncbi:unnamed protein product [Orchesella dallaii]|uniref:Secreted protein n=1 Tax=Orchesella dallaii TaxID=48710 RepID=A0ABP1RK35_9HEXA
MLKSFTWIIALTQCLLHLVVPGGAADPVQMSYPIGTNCFKDVPKTNVAETERKLADIREMCDDISEPEDRVRLFT